MLRNCEDGLHDVLPSIQHSLYAIDEVLANPDILIKALEELKAERLKNNQLWKQ